MRVLSTPPPGLPLFPITRPKVLVPVLTVYMLYLFHHKKVLINVFYMMEVFSSLAPYGMSLLNFPHNLP